jgi:hypothetical protein
VYRLIPESINKALWDMGGGSPKPFHVWSVILHASVVCVLVSLCRRLGYKPYAVALFAVHPVITGTACYIIQNSVIMATLFCLLAFRAYLDKVYVLTLVLWGLACVCKPIAWMFPAVLFGWEWSNDKLNVRYLGGLILAEAAGIAYVLMRVNPVWTGRHFNVYERVCTQGKVLFYYLYKIFMPWTGNLTLNHDFEVISHLGWMYLFVVIAVLLFVLSSRMWSYAVFAYCALLVMESSVLNLEMAFEHRLYMPLAFVVPAVASVKFDKKVLVLVVGYFAAVSLWYQGIWSSRLAMWEHCVRLTPQSARANLNLGRQYALRNDGLTALAYYRRAMLCDYRKKGEFHKWARIEVAGNAELMPWLAERVCEYAKGIETKEGKEK